MKILLLILVTIVSVYGIKLTKSGDYVIDDKNKLMWQDTKDNIRVIVTHEHAIEYCSILRISGFSDWRLPTVEDYKLVIDKNRKRELMIHKSFKYVKADEYWTQDRTWIRNFGQYAYYVFFKSGSIYYQNRTYPMYVRCVRDLK